MNMTHFLVAAPIVLTTLFAVSLSDTNNNSALAQPKAEITIAQAISPTTTSNCHHRSCPQKY